MVTRSWVVGLGTWAPGSLHHVQQRAFTVLTASTRCSRHVASQRALTAAILILMKARGRRILFCPIAILHNRVQFYILNLRPLNFIEQQIFFLLIYHYKLLKITCNYNKGFYNQYQSIAILTLYNVFLPLRFKCWYSCEFQWIKWLWK